MAKKAKRGLDDHKTKLANTYARAFNSVAERQGIELPMPLIAKLVELFRDAIDTGDALGTSATLALEPAQSVDAVDPHVEGRES